MAIMAINVHEQVRNYNELVHTLFEDNYGLFKPMETLEPMAAILVRFPQLRKVSSTARESAMLKPINTCPEGTHKWLKDLGASSTDPITLQDIVKAVYTEQNLLHFSVVRVWLYVVSGYIDLTENTSWWNNRDKTAIQTYLDSLVALPYSNPSYGAEYVRKLTRFTWKTEVLT